jgi:hypothetical protein
MDLQLIVMQKVQKLRLAIAVTYKFVGPAAIHASSLSFSIRPDQYKRGVNQPRHHTVLKRSGGTCTLFLAHRTRQKANSMIIFIFTHGGSRTRSFGLTKGMSIVLWKGPRIPLASIRQCKIEKGCIRRAKTSHVPAPFGDGRGTNHPLGPGIWRQA